MSVQQKSFHNFKTFIKKFLYKYLEMDLQCILKDMGK
jgi:hypothetical protein